MLARMAAVEAAGLVQNPRAQPLLATDGKESREGNGAAGHLSDPCEASFTGAEPNRQQAPASKLKKTAFKFFGGKRSICTLPSFFGGKSKSQAKGASKKGLSKSRTHDGLSDLAHEEASSGGLRSPSDGGPDFPPAQLLPSSQSAVLGAELRVGFTQTSNFLSSHSEGLEKKPAGEKSLFLPRSKKGLKGLFNSIRRHRKNKVAEPEKTELQEWTLRDSVAEEQPCGSGPAGTVTPEYGEDFSGDAVPQMPNHKEEGEMGCMATSPVGSVGEAAVGGPACPEGSQGEQPELEDACADSAYDDLPFEPEFLEKDPPRVASGEQLSLMFGEVTSLKSFDSFTGCGDIIAEPDIESITESSTPVERSRDATKRTSCLVTYQGGGEEMALPEDLEEYLQQVWAGAVKGDAASEAHLPELIARCDLQGMSGAKQEVHLYTEGTRSDTDLLTPQSDQQESAPNSDEGYYDSTTPGPEDEAAEGLEEVRKDRLPRDSYSGDALYEFYEPDEALMSPSHGEGSWFDGKGSPSKMFDPFLDFALPDEKGLIWRMDQKSEGMETEEQRLAALQKQLLFWDAQGEPALKHLQELRGDQRLRPGQPSECKMPASALVGKSSSCPGYEQMNFCTLDDRLSGGKQLVDNPGWEEDFHQKLRPEKLCDDSSGTTQAHKSCLTPPLENGSALGSGGEHPVLDPCALVQGSSATCPLYRASGHHRCSPRAESLEPCREHRQEPEQAVNFSQALEEFTSNGTLFSSLSESLGSSDSDSAFTQNLPDLPTMVTFDIVDVEQEGEGECEEHLELSTGEDLAVSLEAFRDTYDSKASFAECDERMFPESPQASFHGGAASLPRRLNPPLLEPLSLCRRSRSLDTESLEFELASWQLSKKSFRPFELCGSSKKAPGPLGLDRGQEVGPHAAREREEATGGLSWPGRWNVPHGKEEEFSLQGEKTGEPGWDILPSQSPWGTLGHPDAAPLAPLGQDSLQAPAGPLQADEGPHPALPALRPLARPSTLLLQAPVVSPEEGSAPQGPGREGLPKKRAWVLPLGGGKGLDVPLSFDFPPSPDKASLLCPPGVVAQGAPRLHTKQC
ncbi:APC membrane recruitment protein 1 [Erythrolamprus reginae]|uniref:APC membrane recruitment protein 1 n=1 Tax=Erythrolamprus reginae TaxID=121349 RepID=UPI00396C62B9